MTLDLNTIYKVDCLHGMKEIESNSVDLILCDLPYGVLKTEHTKWDVRIPFEPLWEQYTRVSKPNTAIILTCTHPFTQLIINSLPKGYKYQELIWYKSSGSGFLNAKKMHVRQHENILVIYKELPVYNVEKYKIDEKYISKGEAKKKNSSISSKAFSIKGAACENYTYKDDGTRYPDTILEVELDTVLPVKSVSRKGMRPTEKPIDLFAYLIRTFSNEGDLVLDNCMGSGTTALACIHEKRNFIGFETDEAYYQMAQERIKKMRGINN